MSRNLSNLYVSESFQYLVQVSGSEFETGLGSAISSVNITASNAVLAATASYYGGTVTSASYAATATSASHALYADTAGTATDVNALYTASVSDATIAFLKGGGGTFQITVDNVASASYALTASYAENAGGATVDTGSLLVTASAALNVITFTKGDASTFDVTVDTGSAASVDTGSLLTTASFSGDQITFTKGDGSTFAGVITSVTSSISASYATNAATATNATSASLATNARNAYVNVSAANVDYHVTFNTINAGYKELLQETEGAQFTYNPSNNKLTVENISATTLSGSLSGNATSATSASYALTASYAENVSTPNLQQVTDTGNTTTTSISASGFYATDTITTQNAVVLGTASIAFLDVTFESASVIYSSGSNIFGDAADDTQTLWGTVDIKTGPVLVTGSVTATSFTGSLLGTASFADNATSASYALTASYVEGGASAFPYTGSADISGSINLDGFLTGSNITTDPTTNTVVLGTAIVSRGTQNNTLIGYSAETAAGVDYSTVVGSGAQSNSSNDVVIGADAVAGGGNSIAIGSNANASYLLSMAVGQGATATGVGGCAVGLGARAGNDSAVIGGGNATDNNNIQVTNVGNNTSANSAGQINIGREASGGTSAADGIAIGRLASVQNNHSQSIVIGAVTSSLGPGSININGKWTYDGAGTTNISGSLTVNGTNIVTAGLVEGSGTDAIQSAAHLTAVPATASSEYSVALGYNARAAAAFNGGTVAIGKNAQTQGRWSITIGEDASSTGASGGNIAMGWTATAANENSIAIGTLAQSTDLSTAVGYNARTSYGSVSYGWGANNQSGYYSTSVGPQSGVVGGTAGNYSVNVGAYSTVAAHETIAIGYNAKCNTNHSQSIMMGSYVTSSAAGEINLNNKWVYDGTSATTFHSDVVVSGSLILSSSDGFVLNTADTYSSSPKVDQIITLTQAEYDAISGSADPNALYVISDTVVGAPATLAGNNTFTGTNTFNSAVYGGVNALSITSLTASLDCSTGNFFTLTLGDGADTYINPSNITAGQTINLQITNGAAGSGTVTLGGNILEPSGSGYVATAAANAVDVVSMISFDGTNLLVNSVKNFV